MMGGLFFISLREAEAAKGGPFITVPPCNAGLSKNFPTIIAKRTHPYNSKNSTKSIHAYTPLTLDSGGRKY